MDLNSFGRKIIYTSVDEITTENIADVIRNVDSVHQQNASDIEYLYEYYKGNQPILGRTKDIRPEINNKIVENRAKEIVDFKVGYLIGEPIQYIGRDGQNGEAVGALNDYMLSEDKESKDGELVTWQMICGTSYRLILPDQDADDQEICPFEIYTLDPRNTAVVYSANLRHEPMLAYYKTEDSEGNTLYEVYTKDSFYEVVDDSVSRAPHALGRIPIIEYPANNARMGAFETVLPLLDALNKVDSNRLDGVEQFIQALIVLTNGSFGEGTTLGKIMQTGILELTSTDGLEQKIQYITQQLDQAQTQTLKDDLYDAILTICAMPNRNGGGSTKDTGIAVIYRDGWSAAETWAKGAELTFKRSEREFLKLALSIAEELRLSISEVEVKFTRRNYEGIEAKAEVLDKLLNNPKVAPRLAFIYSNLFPDPEEAYAESKAYYEEEGKLLEATA